MLFCADSDLAFDLPSSRALLATAPHHGSESNAAAYGAVLQASPDVTWVRSDGRFASRPCSAFLEQRPKAVLHALPRMDDTGASRRARGGRRRVGRWPCDCGLPLPLNSQRFRPSVASGCPRFRREAQPPVGTTRAGPRVLPRESDHPRRITGLPPREKPNGLRPGHRSGATATPAPCLVGGDGGERRRHSRGRSRAPNRSHRGRVAIGG